MQKDDNIGHSVTYDIKKVYLYLVSDKSWKVCPGHSNGVTYMSLNNRAYDSEWVTTDSTLFKLHILYAKSIAFMSKHIHSLP